MSLAIGLSVLFIFSTSFLIFAVVSFVSFYFYCELYHVFASTNFFFFLILVVLNLRLGCLFNVFRVS